jgi:CHAT domain-containing protein
MRLFIIAFCFWASLAAAQAPFKMPTNPSYAQLDSLVAFYYGDNTDFSIAEEILTFGLAKIEDDSGRNSYYYALYLDNLSYLHLELQHFKLADSLAKEVLALATKNNIPQLSIQALNTLGILAVENHDWAQAETYYLTAKAAAEQHNEEEMAIDILANLSHFYQNIGDFTQAELLIQESLQRQIAFKGKTPNYCAILSNAISLYDDMEKNDAAEAAIKELLKLFETTVSDDIFHAHALNNAATYFESVGKYEQAKKCLEQALALDKTSLSFDMSDNIRTKLSLAKIYNSLDYWAPSEKLYLEALAKAESMRSVKLIAQIPDIYEFHTGLATLYYKQAKFDLANKHLANALQEASGLANISGQASVAWADSLQRFDYPSYLQLSHTITALATVMEVREKPAEKLIIANLAIALLQRKRDINAHDNDKLAALKENYYWLNQIFLLLEPTKNIEKAFGLAELNKAVLLLQANNATAAYQLGGLPKELADKEKALDKRYSELEAHLKEAYAKNSRDSLRKLLNDLGIEKRSLRKEIDTKYPQYAALKYQQAEPKTTEIQAALPENTALIEYVVLDTATFIFYIDKQKAFLQRADISRTALEYKVKTLHNALSNYDYILETPEDAYANYTKNAAAMYELLLAPVLAEAKNEQIKSLIIVPDGHLAYLPFEAFLSQPAPAQLSPYQDLAYLIKDYSLSYSYSAQLWKNSEQAAKMDNNGQILAMAGDYQTNRSSKKSSKNSVNTEAAAPAVRSPKHNSLRKALAPLPAAQEEVQLLSQIFKGHFALGDAASELKFKQQAENYAVIHLAMHGILDEQNPILSSLAFTEDGGAENNFLQVYEISKMKLNADLVVLSACETGYGKFQAGNGVASLARSFMYAGVNALVVSLWAVNDASTAIIMRFFYQNLDKGMGKAEALQQAKLEYLSEAKGTSAHPALWSPFIQLGNRKPVSIAKQASLGSYFIFALAPLGGLGLLYFVRCRKNVAA